MSTPYIHNPNLREALISAYATEDTGGQEEVKALTKAVDMVAFFMTEAQRAHERMDTMRGEFLKLPQADLDGQLAILSDGLEVSLFVLDVDDSDIKELREQAKELGQLPTVIDIEMTKLIIKVGYCAVADSNDEEIGTLREAVEYAVQLLGQRAQDPELAEPLDAMQALAEGYDNDPEIENLQEALRSALHLLGANSDDVDALKEEGERRWDEE